MHTQLEDYILHIKNIKKHSTHTVEAYSNDIKSFLEFLEKEYEIAEIKEVKDIHIRSWFSELIQKGHSPSTIKRKKAALSSFFNHLIRESEIEITPIQNIKTPKQKTRLPEFISENKINKIFEKEIEELETFEEIRDRTIIEIFYLTGIRVSELVDMDINSFNSTYSILKIKGKGNKERKIPLLTELKKVILYYTKQKEIAFDGKETENFIFLTKKGKKTNRKFVYRIIYSYLSKITTQSKKSPHVMRHTFATHLLNHGAELNAIKDLLGHSSLAATQLYTHNSIEQLKYIYKNTHPHSKNKEEK